MNALDRCDACGARARHCVEFSGDRELMFCSHCYDNHKDRLPRPTAAASSGPAGE